MNKLQMHPCERTNYYSGMMLSEKDMLNEQAYMNGRRYLGNKYLHGVGVAGGLTILKVDDELLSLEVGMAIDSQGREILVDEPRLIRLSQIDGYEEFMAQEECTRAYLCIKYAEERMTEDDICLIDEGDDSQRCKRIREGYQLYLTTLPLSDFGMTLEYFRGQENLIYTDENVIIVQRVPNYVEAGKPFDSQIIIISQREGTKVELHLCENLSCLNFEDGEEFRADCKATIKESHGIQRYSFTFNAYNVEDGTAEMRVSPDNSYVVIDGEKKELLQDICIKTSVTGRNEYLEATRRYYIDHFEHHMELPDGQDIYLAAVFVDRSDGGCRIEKVKTIPFAQISESNFLQMGIMDRIIKDIDNIRNEIKQGETPEHSKDAHISKKPKISSGEYVFKIALGAKNGERLISEDIVHGLGLGPVTIDISVVEDMNQLHGAPGIFDEMQLKLETAVLSDMSKGTFRIGLRVTEVTALQEIKIHWTAMMNPAEKAEDERQKRVTIVPDKLEMKTLQNYYLKAEADNLTGAVILWEVTTPNGGMISRDGLYTAPDLPGVYEVSAFCQESPEIRDSIFIIVRE